MPWRGFRLRPTERVRRSRINSEGHSCDVFIVWNRGWKRMILTREDLSLVPDSELIAVKLRWTFRK
jgi:hypothetical protein